MKRKICIVLIAAMLMTVALVPNFGASSTVYAAGETKYSNVLDDLKKDETFNAEFYPVIKDDTDEKYYSLEVIQIAESVDGELFVYVYQPSGEAAALRASYMTLSTEPKENIEPHLYELAYLNSNGALYKYVVQDFKVLTVDTRYYTIPSILRPYIEGVDDESGNDNTISNVPYTVAKQYTFGDINGNSYVNVDQIETIEVTSKWVGFCRYPEGWVYGSSNSCDNHFVAFSTDKPMDKLLAADIRYTIQDYTHTISLFYDDHKYSDPQSLEFTLLGENITHKGWGLWGGTYEWKTIQTVEEFIKSETRTDVYEHGFLNQTISTKLSQDALKSKLEGKTWVLRFLDTNFYSSYYEGGGVESYSIVSDVIILRLNFVYKGKTYNLGVVDNTQSGDREPDNEWDEKIELAPNWWEQFLKWLAIILGIFLIAILIIVLLPIILPAIAWIFKAIIWLIALPFKAIASLFKKKDKK